jgi:hypothetical protein
MLTKKTLDTFSKSEIFPMRVSRYFSVSETANNQQVLAPAVVL